MIVPPGVKVPPLDQRKKRGFCKYHNFLGHKTSQCFLFRNLVQDAIEEGRLKFADKTPMTVDSNPLQAEAYYAEPSEVNVIEASRSQSKRPVITMVEVSKDHVNMPIFGSFSGNLSRKTIEAV